MQLRRRIAVEVCLEVQELSSRCMSDSRGQFAPLRQARHCRFDRVPRNLAAFVKIQSHIFLTKYLLDPLLVIKPRNPNLRSVRKLDIEVRFIELNPQRRKAELKHLRYRIQVEEMKRCHLKSLIADYSDTPHKAKHILTAIRKMITVALDEEWIEVDPSYKLNWRPEYVGWKAWTDEAMAKFENRWPIGTTPRLVYSLALWLGNRRGDVAGLRWDQRCAKIVHLDGEAKEIDGFMLRQGKTGKELFIPITPILAEVLDATDRKGGTVLVTAYGEPFSPKSLTGRMADWTHAAGIEKGFTLHGLRKTLGKMLAEGGASTRQIMDTLGHDDIAHAELYSREAEQARLATDGMSRIVRLKRNG